MKYAIVGCGRISELHIKAALECGLEFVGLCDLVRDKAIQRRAMLSADTSVGVYTDYKKMLDETAPELVAVTTDSGAHAEIALECISRGINVIIEKSNFFGVVFTF